MNQPSSKIWNDLNAYFDGELDREQRVQMEQLLFEDPQYAQALVQWREIRRQFQTLPTSKAKPQLTDSILQKVEAELNSGNLQWKPTESLLGVDPLFRNQTSQPEQNQFSVDRTVTTKPEGTNDQTPSTLSKQDIHTWTPKDRLRRSRHQMLAVGGVVAMMLFVVVYSNVGRFSDFTNSSAFITMSESESSLPKKEGVSKDLSTDSKGSESSFAGQKRKGVAESFSQKSKEDMGIQSRMRTGPILEKSKSGSPKNHVATPRKKGGLKGSVAGRGYLNDSADHVPFAQTMDQESQLQVQKIERGVSSKNQDPKFYGTEKSESKKKGIAKNARQTDSFDQPEKKIIGGMNSPLQSVAASQNSVVSQIPGISQKSVQSGFGNPRSAVPPQFERKLNMGNYLYVNVKPPKTRRFAKLLSDNLKTNGWSPKMVAPVKRAIQSKLSASDANSFFLVGNPDSILNVLKFLNDRSERVNRFEMKDCDPSLFQYPEMQTINSTNQNQLFYLADNNNDLQQAQNEILQRNLIYNLSNSFRSQTAQTNRLQGEKIDLKSVDKLLYEQQRHIVAGNQVPTGNGALAGVSFDRNSVNGSIGGGTGGGLSIISRTKSSDLANSSASRGQPKPAGQKTEDSIPGKNSTSDLESSSNRGLNVDGLAQQTRISPPLAQRMQTRSFPPANSKNKARNQVDLDGFKISDREFKNLFEQNFNNGKSSLSTTVWLLVEFDKNNRMAPPQAK